MTARVARLLKTGQHLFFFSFVFSCAFGTARGQKIDTIEKMDKLYEEDKKNHPGQEMPDLLGEMMRRYQTKQSKTGVEIVRGGRYSLFGPERLRMIQGGAGITFGPAARRRNRLTDGGRQNFQMDAITDLDVLSLVDNITGATVHQYPISLLKSAGGSGDILSLALAGNGTLYVAIQTYDAQREEMACVYAYNGPDAYKALVNERKPDVEENDVQGSAAALAAKLAESGLKFIGEDKALGTIYEDAHGLRDADPNRPEEQENAQQDKDKLKTDLVRLLNRAINGNKPKSGAKSKKANKAKTSFYVPPSLYGGDNTFLWRSTKLPRQIVDQNQAVEQLQTNLQTAPPAKRDELLRALAKAIRIQNRMLLEHALNGAIAGYSLRGTKTIYNINMVSCGPLEGRCLPLRIDAAGGQATAYILLGEKITSDGQFFENYELRDDGSVALSYRESDPAHDAMRNAISGHKVHWVPISLPRPASKASPNSTSAAEIKAAYQGINKAMQEQNLSQYASYFADAFTYKSNSGKDWTRAQFLSVIERLINQGTLYTIDIYDKPDAIILLPGGTVQIDTKLTFSASGERAKTASSRDIWAKVGGQWKIVHSTTSQ